MTTPERVLYQFPISHYCEKTRWNLEAKGLSYRIRNMVPGVHVPFMKRLTGRQTVPVLVDRGAPISDSTAIALHLEEAYPDSPLLPKDAGERARALDIEDHFDRKVGTAVRKWVYGQLMKAKTGGAAEVLFGAYPLPVRVLGKIAGPLFEGVMRKVYNINPEGLDRAYSSILAAADRIEAETEGDPSRYLVGGALSIADITAASLLGPIVAAPRSPYARTPASTPAIVLDLRAKLNDRPAGRWVLARYEHDRGKRAPASAFQPAEG